jgi:glycosyltransferase involved in cell wall biosynthesis
MTRMAEGLMRASSNLGIDSLLSLSRQNVNFDHFATLGDRLLPMSTFSDGLGAIMGLFRMPSDQDQLVQRLRALRCDAVVMLMPHVWSPFFGRRVRQAGLPYAVVVHDALQHPGDRTGMTTKWLLRDAAQADIVFTLSHQVANQLRARGFGSARISKLFHPALAYPSHVSATCPLGGPVRLLFFGRILPYKGLGLFIDALEILRADGAHVEASVVGEGSLGRDRLRLESLGVAIHNHWVSDEEVSNIFTSHDIVVATHVEASQSGIVATALAHNRPVVVTPVGGLVEQVDHGRTGLIASAATGEAVAAVLRCLVRDPVERLRMREAIRGQVAEFSSERFLVDMLAQMARPARAERS